MLDFFISRMITCKPGHDSLFRENLILFFHRWHNCTISIHKTVEFFIKLFGPSTCVVPFNYHVACTFLRHKSFGKKIIVMSIMLYAHITYQPAETLAQCRMMFLSLKQIVYALFT